MNIQVTLTGGLTIEKEGWSFEVGEGGTLVLSMPGTSNRAMIAPGAWLAACELDDDEDGDEDVYTYLVSR